MAKFANGQVIVEPGDTLWSIYGPQWKQLSGYQGNPLQLQPGTVLPNSSPAASASKAPQQSSQQNSSPAPNKAFYTPQNGLNAVSSPGYVAGTPDWVKPLIARASAKYNVPSVILSALLKQESGFNPNAQSHVGAAGIAQFMPATAQDFGIDPWDPEQAIPAAAKYIRNELDRFGGKMDLALAAYNAGAGAVQQYGGIPPYKETQNYVKSIMGMAGEGHATANQTAIDIRQEAKKQSDTTKNVAMSPAIQRLNRDIEFRNQPVRSSEGEVNSRFQPGRGMVSGATDDALFERVNDIEGQVAPLQDTQGVPDYVRWKYALPKPSKLVGGTV